MKKLLCIFISFTLIMNPILISASTFVRPGIPCNPILIAKADNAIYLNDDSVDAYNQGLKDGRSILSFSLWFLIGYNLGLIGIGAAYIVGGGNPPISKSATMGPLYIEGYKKTSRNMKTKGALLGFLSVIVYALVRAQQMISQYQ